MKMIMVSLQAARAYTDNKAGGATAWSRPAVQNAAGTFGRTWETLSVCVEVENTKNNLHDSEFVPPQTRHVDESSAGFLGKYLAALVQQTEKNMFLPFPTPF